MSATIGFIGLGAMGEHMSANLVQDGWRVVGYDRRTEQMDAVVERGVNVARSCAEVAAAADEVIISMVRDVPQTETVLFGEDGVVAADVERTVILMSTLGPLPVSRLAATAEQAGLTLVDAPVMSGTIPQAIEASLRIVVGAAPHLYGRVEPILAAMGEPLHVGPQLGLGQAAKLVNQVMMAVAMAGTLEGITLARDYGIDVGTILPILLHGTASSWAVQNLDHVERIWHKPGDPVDLIYKDLGEVMAAAASRHLYLPVASATFSAFSRPWHSGAGQ
jgi:3-hydroxyisobutyrate dehydrogenase-like beta-hydroxyacid dehydrogenase